jgi:hypothetical protein
MPTITTTEGVYIPLPEAVAGALTDKDDQLLSLNASGQAVLFDGTSPAFAVHAGKLSPDSGFVKARLLAGAGTARVIQDAAIAVGARVAGKAGTSRVQTAAAGARSLGFKLTPTAGAQGDVIEIAVLVENLPA